MSALIYFLVYIGSMYIVFSNMKKLYNPLIASLMALIPGVNVLVAVLIIMDKFKAKSEDPQ